MLVNVFLNFFLIIVEIVLGGVLLIILLRFLCKILKGIGNIVELRIINKIGLMYGDSVLYFVNFNV